MKKTLLFVDNDQAFLSGLEESLNPHQRHWDMKFVNTGEAALAELSAHRFDVVVTEINMPEIDGQTVLDFLKQHRPKTLRIALTGISDRQEAVRLSSLAHRCISKPCETHELELAISRDCGLIEAFDSPAVIALAGRAGRLPGSDPNSVELLRVLNGPGSSAADVADLVERDIALTAKLLQMVNSSFFKRQKNIESAKQAVAYLGIDIVRSLVLAEQIFHISKNIENNPLFCASKLHDHCMATATYARDIMQDTEYADSSFTAGLLHDVGKFIIAMEAPEKLAELAKVSLPGQWPDEEHERRILGATHEEVGGCFLNLWGIPTAIVEAVTFHSKPSNIYSCEVDTVGATHIANYLAHKSVANAHDSHIATKLDMDYVEQHATDNQYTDWVSQAA